MEKAGYNARTFNALKQDLSDETELSKFQINCVLESTWSKPHPVKETTLIRIAEALRIQVSELYNPMPQKLETSLTPA